MTRRPLVVPLLLVLAVTSACQDPDEQARDRVPTAPGAPLVFASQGGCADAYFWAATSADSRAITVSADLRERPSTSPTTLDVTLPDPRVEVTLQLGDGLSSVQCTDLPQGEVAGEVPVTAGHVVIVVAPPGPVGRTSGRAELSGLVTGDGTRVPDTTITTEQIGFYAG